LQVVHVERSYHLSAETNSHALTFDHKRKLYSFIRKDAELTDWVADGDLALCTGKKMLKYTFNLLGSSSRLNNLGGPPLLDLRLARGCVSTKTMEADTNFPKGAE